MGEWLCEGTRESVLWMGVIMNVAPPKLCAMAPSVLYHVAMAMPWENSDQALYAYQMVG